MTDFTIRFDNPLASARLIHVDGTERLNEPSRFRARCVFPAGTEATDATALIGVRSVVGFEGHASPRRIGGVVHGVLVEARLGSGELQVVLDLRSSLSKLGHRRTRRIFQGLTVLEIIDKLLEAHGIAHSTPVSRTLAKRDFCLQYDETDLAFMKRLASEEGLVFFSGDPHGDSLDEEVFIADSADGFFDVTGETTLVMPAGVTEGEGLVQEEHHVRGVRLAERTGPRRVLHRHYDPMKPLAPRMSRAAFDAGKAPRAALPAGEAAPATPGPIGHTDLSIVYASHAEDDSVVATSESSEVLLAQLRHKARRLEATSPCVRLGPGRVFKLHHADESALDAEYTIHRVHHQYRIHPAGPHEPRYVARFSFAPKAQVPRGRPVKRPPREIMETAVVVGPATQEIHTDKHGRIKIQFHWDLDGTMDGNSSCWVRVAQPWAGSGFGAFFLPRVGMEVIVSFLGGDPDRPVVLGALYHAVNVPPFAQPNESTVTGLVTRSTPGGDGHHELRFDDAKGRELVRLRSERDLEILSTHDTKVGVGGDRATNITGDDHLVVKGNRHEIITGARSVEVQGDSEELRLGGTTTVVMGKRTEHVADLAHSIFDRGAIISTSGEYSARVSGDYSLMVGSGESIAQTSVDGRLAMGSTRMLTLRSDESIRMQVGTSVFEITPDGISLEAENITLKGKTITAEGNGPKLSLGDNAELLSEEVKIYSKKGGIEMKEDTEIWGASLKLQPKKDQPTKSSETGDAKTKPFKVKLTDADFEPIASKHYVLFAEGQRLEGETSGEGAIDVEITEEATRVDITVYLEDYPTGKTKKFSINVAVLPPERTWPGALIRLHNLGYYEEAPDKTEPTETEKKAVRWFQKDHELEETGELTGALSAALKKAHGS